MPLSVAPVAVTPVAAGSPPAQPAGPSSKAAGTEPPTHIPPTTHPPATPVRQGPPNLDPIDDKARRLAEFFNGEVVQLDGPLPDLLNDDEAAA